MKIFKIVFFVFFMFLNYFSFAKDELIPYQIKEKIGFLDEQLNVVFFPEYDDFMYCYKGWAYAFIKTNNTTMAYILNQNGRIIRVPSGNSGFVIGLNYYGFTDYSNSIVYSIISDTKYEFQNFRLFTSEDENFISLDDIKNRPRHNYINLKGELFFSHNEDLSIVWFDKNINRGAKKENGWTFLIDENLNQISKNKWGFINSFSCGLALTDEGFIDTNGQLVIKISRIPEMDITFQCNVIPVVITKSGNYELYSKEECCGANWAILDTSGQIVRSNINADYISSFSNEGTAVIYKFINNKACFNLINKKGEKLLNKTFDRIETPVNGYSRAKRDGVDYLINVISGEVYNCDDF